MNLELADWRAASTSARADSARAIGQALGGDYRPAAPSPDDHLPAFEHVPTGLVLRLVPGGTLRMGFTERDADGLEDAAAAAGIDPSPARDLVAHPRSMRPVHDVRVPAFLLAERCVSEGIARALLGRSEDDDTDATRLLDRAGVTEMARALDRLGLRLPSEAEWEHASRAGRASRFAGGDAVPERPWTGANPWGFVDFGADSEVCADAWSPTYAGASNDASPRMGGPRKARACRGGASRVWPWQDTGEWLMMLCAYRESAAEADEFLAVRPARPL